MMRQSGGCFAGAPALVRNAHGAGEAYYFGAAFGVDTAELFLRRLGAAEPYGEQLLLPKEVELAVRKKDGTAYLFVLNYQQRAVEIEVKRPMQELLSGQALNGKLKMKPYEVMVFV